METNYLKEFFKQKSCAAFISSYYYKDGYCHLKREDLAKFLNVKKLDTTSIMINKLVKNNWISNKTVNGFYMRIKLLDKDLICPDFILNEELPLFVRGFLYCIKDCEIPKRKVDQIKIYSKFFEVEKRKIEKILYSTTKLLNINDILSNFDIIHFDLNNLYDNLNYSYNGFYYRKAAQDIYCKYCGSLLNNNNKYEKEYKCCKNCSDLLKTDSGIISSLLYKRSKHNSVNYDFDYSIDKKYLSDILIEQNFKCAYSGLDFDLFDTIGVPTVDRIDSNKGYVKGNVSIVRCDVNKMKSDYNLDRFKLLIKSLNNNISNFQNF